MSIDNNLLTKVSEWLEWDKNPKTRAEIDALVVSNQLQELRTRLAGRMAFGTAGMRATMEAGFTRMNDLTIIQTSQGLAAHLLATFGTGLAGVVVGYDIRHNSERWARLTANVLVKRGIRVYLFREYCATPHVPYAVLKLKLNAGVIITASHNPAKDNGYKAYWANGAQIMSPVDKDIEKAVLQNLQPIDADVWDEQYCLGSPLCVDPRALPDSFDIIEHYFADEKKYCSNFDLNAKSPLRICYTPVHGVGQKFTPRFLHEIGFKTENIFDTPEQREPDADFSTCPFPNPEEGRPVLKWALIAGEAHNCDIVLANDPDADRLQLAERDSNAADGWRVFSGNEMGTILGAYLWTAYRRRHPDSPAGCVHMMNSVVSTKFLRTMAQREGFVHHQTLTGFKYMGSLISELRTTTPSDVFLFAFEESIGFMPGTALDKDGILAAGMFAECAAYVREVEGRSLVQYLADIYKQYGYHITVTSYFVNRDPVATVRFFNNIRYGNADGADDEQLKYPTHIAGMRVEHVRDLTVGYDSEQPDKKPVLPVSKSSQMITFTLEGGRPLTLRASGTEPKIKYYFEQITAPGKHSNEAAAITAEVRQIEQRIVDEFIRPTEWGFQLRAL